VRSNKKTQYETGPVVDITHQRDWKYEIDETEHSHEEGELEEPGDKTNQKSNSHPEI
jgi:hypothetical protein